LSYDEWAAVGLVLGYIDAAVCGTHDGVEVTEQEFDDEVCVPITRLRPPGSGKASG